MRALPVLTLAAVALAGCGEEAATRLDEQPVAAKVDRATVSGPQGRIAFKRHPDGDEETAALFTIRADGKRERQITSQEPGTADERPDWSPDGSLLVFERSGTPVAVYTVKPDGSRLRRVTPECAASGPGVETVCEDASYPSFQPDGKRVAYTRSTGEVRTLPGGEQWIAHSDIVVRKVDGGDARVVLRSRPYTGDLSGARFSPDGKQLLYVRWNSPLGEPAGGRAIFVADADGTGRRQITPWSLDAGDDPDWSPDGKLILFRSHLAGAKQSQLHVVRPDGSRMRALTRFEAGTEVLSASFAPDGKWITFAKTGEGGEPDIFVMRANGKDIRPVTATPVWESMPDWGPLG
jgi:TolB protein